MAKALALFSGGLDSTLAARLLLEQNVEIEAVHFISLFTAHKSSAGKGLAARRAAEQLGVSLRIEGNSQELLAIVKSPKHGYGRNINPCIDCRMRNLSRGAEIMRETGANFLVTGEVVGERPMSQNRTAMRLIDKETGLEGLVLRPLSAKLLEPTLPEKEGWVDRDRLLEIHGRSRKPQFELAREFGIRDFPTPAGGCLLTDPGFAARMRDLLAHDPDCDLNDAHLLKVGRHFRLDPSVKAIIGRDERENHTLESFARDGDLLMEASDYPGPITLVRGPASEEQTELAAAITIRYGKAGRLPRAKVKTRTPGAPWDCENLLEAAPADEECLARLRIAPGDEKRGGRRARSE